jgi:NADH-quinone oxidoreductase subunit G
MPKIVIDNVSYEVRDGQNLLEAGLEQGLNIPYFCWHAALGSAGACRQCAVKQYANPEDTRGRLVMACMTPASEGTRISVDDAEAKDFRANVVEMLMTSHPHDCPVCDEGGECHLQDMTVMTGHNYRDYRFQKRTHQNQDLGPLINHEMNRCITCYRCVRFYRDYAGGEDLQAFASKNHVYFGRSESGTLESEFSGNLVEVCPTGVFTDKTAKQHYTRRWDLTTAPSICGHCATGCNTLPGERYGLLRRVRNRYNGEINGYFLCDRGRFGYEYVNAATRIRQAERRQDGVSTPMPPLEAAAQVGAWLRDAPGRTIGIGSPRASLEDNFALRSLVGAERFSAGMAARDLDLIHLFRDCLRLGTAPAPSLNDIEGADAVLILGEDVQQMAARVALSIRQASRNAPFAAAKKVGIPAWNDLAVREIVQSDRGPLIIAAPGPTRLDDIATERVYGAPEDLARFGFAVAGALDGEAPLDLPEGYADAVARTVEALRGASKVVVVAGATLGSADLARAAAKVAWALRKAERESYLALLPLEGNAVGAGLLQGMALEQAVEQLEAGQADSVIVLENDLYRRADRSLIDRLFAAAKHVAVLDHTRNPTTARADVLLPASTFAEGDGTLVNYEGRAQRYYQVFVPEGEQIESWRIAREIALAAGRADLDWRNLDDVVDALEAALPALAPIEWVAPDAKFRVQGLKIPRQSHRASGRTAMQAHRNVSEGAVPVDVDSALSFSMEGYLGAAPPALSSFQWAPGWNSPQSVTRFQEEINGPLRGGDPGIRLFEPAGKPPALGAAPAAFAPRPGSVRLLPIQHLFGSDELSVHAPGIAQLAPTPYVAVSGADAAALGLADGSPVELALDGQVLALPLKVLEHFPAGCAGVPAGLAMLPLPALPCWAELRGKGEA